MRNLVLLLAGVVVFAGCDSSIVKNDYMDIDKLKKTKKFVGYDIEVGPILLSGLKPNMMDTEKAKSEDESIANENRFMVPNDWREQDGLSMEGPLRVTKEINAKIRMETLDVFHRRVKVKDKYYYFKLAENVKGYGFRVVSVRNKKDELGVVVLKTAGKVPSWDDPANRVGQGVDPNFVSPSIEARKKRSKNKDDSDKDDSEKESKESSEDK